MFIRFCKYQALGNDYLILADSDQLDALSADVVRRLCNRHYGVGADGVLAPRDTADSIGVTIWNADGSQAEKSGNGLRIYAKFLWDEGRLTETSFRIHADGGDVQAEILVGTQDVKLGLGVLKWPGLNPAGNAPQPESILLDGEPTTCYLANIGNPHCVLFVDEPTMALTKQLGPQIESHPLFPQRTNVQFVKVVNREKIRLEIWERGSGYTRSSGSSASAAVGVAHGLDLVDSCVEAVMPGGTLKVSIDRQNFVTICGPAIKIADILIDSEQGLSMEPSA
jgi:diaminopimelate epimerase